MDLSNTHWLHSVHCTQLAVVMHSD